MKKIVIIGAILAILLLTGCQPKQAQPLDLTGGMFCTVTVTLGEQVITAQLERTVTGICRLSVQEPSELEGLTFDWTGDALSLQYKGLNWDLEADALPSTAFAAALMKCLDIAAKKDGLETQSIQQDRVTTRGYCDAGEFQLVYDQTRNQVISIELDALDLTAEFSDYTTK